MGGRSHLSDPMTVPDPRECGPGFVYSVNGPSGSPVPARGAGPQAVSGLTQRLHCGCGA